MKTTQLKLIEPFFTEELDYKNDYVTYIEVSNSSSVTPKNNNSKISLKTYSRFIDNVFIKNCPLLNDKNSSNIIFLDSESECLLFITPDYLQHKGYYETYESFSILTPQSHNNILSLV